MEIIKILIVDDEESNLSLLEYVLKRYHYKVDRANNGLIAIDKFVISEYDIVLLDVMMPLMDGIETCIRMNEYNKNIPVILLTALNDEDVLKRGFDAGAWDYITKPWSEVDLISRIEKANKVYTAEKKIRTLYDTLKREHEKQNKEIQLAVEVQNYFLPKWMLYDKCIKVSSTYNPSVGLGGDIYDFLPINPHQYIIYIGDVSGHGVQAALMMTAVKALIKMIVDEEKKHLSLPGLVSRLNKILAKNVFNNKFLTLLIMLFDFEKKQMTFYNAGHPPFLILNKKTKEIKKASDVGVYPIGWNEALPYSASYENVMPLNEDEFFLFYTDGVTESPCNDNECLTTQGLISLISQDVNIDEFETLPYQIKQIMKNKQYNIAYDDFTIFAVCPACDKHPDYSMHQFINLENISEDALLKVLSVQLNSWQIKESVKSVIDQFERRMYGLLVQELKGLLFENLLLINMTIENHNLKLKNMIKIRTSEQNKAIVHARLSELISDPLFSIYSVFKMDILDDLACLNLEIKL
ncbi:MAG TPA: SpoIIE family protein phosphatase [Candidatus Cloacimonadota bacterium]|nr:SpoIIE family protein phosphatase [Candidatus Cloacimonadota bacterium]